VSTCLKLLLCLTCFQCIRIAELEEQNRMSVSNLAAIFGPIMMNVDKVRN